MVHIGQEKNSAETVADFPGLGDEPFVTGQQPKIVPATMVLVMVSAWLAISNHCAIGAAVPEVKPAQNECPFHAKKSAPKKQASDSPCCKILRAIASVPAKTVARGISDLPDVDFGFVEFIPAEPPEISVHSATLDTGPPGTTSFTELIGSLRAHAPPFLA